MFLGEAVPVWGPVTPGNKPWFSPNVPRYPHSTAKARELLKSIGLEDRNNNGIVEDEKGTEARFTVLTQRGLTYYERGTTVLRDARQGCRHRAGRRRRWSPAPCSSVSSPAITTPSTCVRS